MESVTIPKEMLDKILTDVEILIDDVEAALDKKVQERRKNIETKNVQGKTEEDLHAYLKKRGVHVE